MKDELNLDAGKREHNGLENCPEETRVPLVLDVPAGHDTRFEKRVGLKMASATMSLGNSVPQ